MKISGLKLALIVSSLLVFNQCGGVDNEVLLPLLNYESWTRCFGNSTKTCFDNEPYLATDVITEYSYEGNGDKALLIWWQYKRSADIFTVHNTAKSYRIESAAYWFYKRSGASWELIETRVFERNKLPKNQEIPLFELTSPFGKEYLAFKSSSADTEIVIPTITFVE